MKKQIVVAAILAVFLLSTCEQTSSSPKKSAPPKLSHSTLTPTKADTGSFNPVSLVLLNARFKTATDPVWKKEVKTTGTSLLVGLKLSLRRVTATQVEISFTGNAEDYKPANKAEGVKLNLKSLVAGKNVPDLFVTLKFDSDSTKNQPKSTKISSPPSISSKTTFTLKESEFNTGFIGPTALFTLSNGEFKIAEDPVWKGTVTTTGNPLPTGLTTKLKWISSTKVEITFTGKAEAHASTIKVEGVKLNLKNFVAGEAVPELPVTFNFEFIEKTPDPIKIYNARELQKINERLNAKFELATDIDLKGVTWIPIGRNTPFSGTLDGKGHTIKNLKIGSEAIYLDSSDRDRWYTGLFGKTRGATIEDLVIDHSGIWGGDFTGALVGHAFSTTITGVSMESTENAVVTGNNFVGGLVGSNDFRGTVIGYATGRVSGNKYVGGLVGNNDYSGSTVIGYATGDVSGKTKYLGLPSKYVGGLVGYVSDTAVVIGYAMGGVSGDQYVGGLVGGASKATVIGYARGVVERKSGSDKIFGLLVGKKVNGSIIKGFHSSSLNESRFNRIRGSQAKGVDGTPVNIATVNDDDYQKTFKGLTFGTQIGQWTQVGAKKWPAINLPPDMGGNSASEDQPTGPK